jgi:hypothetical protein
MAIPQVETQMRRAQVLRCPHARQRIWGSLACCSGQVAKFGLSRGKGFALTVGVGYSRQKWVAFYSVADHINAG